MEMIVLLRVLMLMFVGYIQGIYSGDIDDHIKDPADDVAQLLDRFRRQSNPHPNCGSQITSSGDVITSPRHPLPYANNRYCIWWVTVPPNHVVHITFESMDITKGRTNRCNPNGDYLQIQEKDRTGDLIGFYCGSRLPGPVISKSNSVWITFHSDSDGSLKGDGFRLVFTAMDPPSSSEGIHLNELQLETGLSNIGNQDKPATTKIKTTERHATEHPITRTKAIIIDGSGEGTDELNTEVSATSKSITTQQRDRGDTHLDIITSKAQLTTEVSATVKTKTTQQTDHESEAEATDKVTTKQLDTASKPPEMTTYQQQASVTSKMPTVPIDGRVIKAPDSQEEKPVARCRDVFVEPNGNFTSPLYPDWYENNMICTWTILADPLEYIGLRFTDFDIDNPMPNGVCDTRYSSVRIAYFDSEGQVASDQFCSSVLPDDIIVSYSNQMVVYFFSELGYGKGFVAEYDNFNPDPAIDGAPVFPKRHLQPGDEVLYPFYSSEEWPDADPDDVISDTCGNLIEISGTLFASPGYPTGYSVLSCLWVIVAKPGQEIKLEFKHFSVGLAPEDGTCDISPALVEVSYYDASGHLMSEELCGGIEESSVFTSLSDRMYVFFTSKQGGQKGFRAEVIFFDAETDQDNGIPVILPETDPDNSLQPYKFYNMQNVAPPNPDSNFCQQLNAECCYDVSDGLPYGTIVSPGYPDGYDQYLNCKWVIQGDHHQAISLHFTDFQLDSVVEEDGECYFDKSLVRVVYFDENHAMQEQFLCGHSQPTTVVSDFHTIYVEFYTFAGPKTTDRGFTAVYLKEDKDDVEPVESSISIEMDMRGLFPFLPVGNVLNDTLVLPEYQPPDVTGEDDDDDNDDDESSSDESSEDGTVLRPGITKRPTVTKRKKPVVEIVTEPIPNGDNVQTESYQTWTPPSKSMEGKDLTELHNSTDLPWSELEDMTVNWSASFNYDSIDLVEDSTMPITTSDDRPAGRPTESNLDGESSGDSPVTEPVDKEGTLSPGAVPVIDGTLPSETELFSEQDSLMTENPQNEQEASGESPSELPRTSKSQDTFTTSDAQIDDMIDDSTTPILDDQLPSADTQNSTHNGSLIDIGGRFISVPVRSPPLSPKRRTPPPSSTVPAWTETFNTSGVMTTFMGVRLPPGESSTTHRIQLESTTEEKATTIKDGKVPVEDEGKNQTRVVTLICASVGSALLLILFIVLVYYAFAKRRASDSMDLAKERTNYWQSYQAFDAPEWRVQQETPEGYGTPVVIDGTRRSAGVNTNSSGFPERLI